MIKKYHVSAQYGNTWNPKSYAKFISGTQTYNKFPITLRTTQQSIPTWSVKGNMVQNGVPSSTAPITPQETGERTAQLLNTADMIYGSWTGNTGSVSVANYAARTQNLPASSLTVSVNSDTIPYSYAIVWVDSNNTFIQRSHIGSKSQILLPQTFNPPDNAVYFYMQIACGSTQSDIMTKATLDSYRIMLNEGSTDLPYQPYGYKLDIKTGSITTPVYLGQVQSTRKIYKYTLTGNENWGTVSGNFYLGTLENDYLRGQDNNYAICSHYQTFPQTNLISNVPDKKVSFSYSTTTQRLYLVDSSFNGNLTNFKAYLAQQYSAGTPVTVWYVLANETTGIVNEPLRKIGNYADSITNSVSLPTVPGINTIDVNTTLKPSEMSLTYDGYKVCKSTKIQQVTREVDFVNNTKSIIGSVDNLKVYQLMNRCNVSDNGTITAYYGDPNYTEDGSNGQVMVYVKKFYYKLDVSQPGDLSGINIRKGRWSISDIPIEGYKLHPAFLAADGVTELSYFLYGAFDAVGQDSNGIYSSSYNTTSYKLSSVGGNTYKPICSLTRATARTMATNRGNGWYQVGVKQTMAIQMLFSVEFGFNSQIAVGRGIVNDTGTHNTGLTIGNKTSGTYDNATTTVNYRGIENLWGNISNFIDGINISNTTPYICSTFTFSDNTSTNYTRISFTLPGINHITAFGYDSNNDWVLLPSETNRSTVDEFGPIGDYFGSNSDWRVARLGGSYIYGRDAGLFYWDCHYNSSYTDVGVGARLMYIPQTT